MQSETKCTAQAVHFVSQNVRPRRLPLPLHFTNAFVFTTFFFFLFSKEKRLETKKTKNITFCETKW